MPIQFPRQSTRQVIIVVGGNIQICQFASRVGKVAILRLHGKTDYQYQHEYSVC